MVSFDRHGMREGAPFNSAVDTLMRISAQLDEIKQISIGVVGGNMIDKRLAQHIKYKAVNMLLVMATPLLKKDKIIELYEEFNSIKLKWAKQQANSYSTPKLIEHYDMNVEKEMNEFLMNIQFTLQEEGYFMPPKGDPRFAFSQE